MRVLTAKAIGREPGPIRIQKGQHDFTTDKGNGDVHLEARHGDQIRSIVDENGQPIFKDTSEYIGFVANNWTEIVEINNGKMLMVVRDPSKISKRNSQKTMIIEMVKSKTNNFYEVITAAKLNNKYMTKYTKIISR